MANPRIEEIDDDDMAADPDEVDLEAFDFSRPQQGSLQSTVNAAGSQMSPEAIQAMLQPQNQTSSSRQQSQSQMPNITDAERERILREQQQRTRNHQCIYPIYFDSTRSRQDGRRVKKEDGVPNPLARELVDALQHVGQTLNLPLQIAFEPSKCHPKDWANPGRVRVLIKEDGRAVSAKIQNKHQLYKLISNYMKAHPTTTSMPLRFRPQGLPMPKDGEYHPPAIPKGFKMGTILPLHSPALSGGGVSDNFLKDMMSEMGGQLPPGMEGMAGLAGAAGGGGGAPKKVKEKKGKK